MSSRQSEFETASSPELLHRFAAAGDQTAFAALVRRHGGWMQGAALRMTGSPEMSGEVIQESFALLARKLPRCPAEAPPPAAVRKPCTRAVQNSDPSAAQAWAATIRDESRRNAV